MVVGIDHRLIVHRRVNGGDRHVFQADRLVQQTHDGTPHPDAVFVLYATLCWYFHLPAPAAGAAGAAAGAPRPEWCVAVNRAGLFEREESLAAAEQSGLILLFDAPRGAGMVARALKRTFWQVPYPFVKLPSPLVYALAAGGARHPIRPRPPRNLYRRHVPSLNAVLSFRLARMDDVAVVNRWMNNARVAAFWGEQGPAAQTAEFLRKGLEKRHSLPVIGCWEELHVVDGRVQESGKAEPFGYFEIYWVKEDILGRYCDAEDWERGIHVLVGEEKFRGQHRVKGWLGGLCQYCFCDDPRTMRISVEPRVDNEKYVVLVLDGAAGQVANARVWQIHRLPPAGGILPREGDFVSAQAGGADEADARGVGRPAGLTGAGKAIEAPGGLVLRRGAFGFADAASFCLAFGLGYLWGVLFMAG